MALFICSPTTHFPSFFPLSPFFPHSVPLSLLPSLRSFLPSFCLSLSSQNSVRHNLSLHSRFNKVQNESSGKSSWWTVDLEAKSGRTSRRNRSQSVDNGNASSSPKTPRKKKERRVKRVKGGTSPSDLSPCDSPTTSSPHLQSPWSPNPSCSSPAPSGADLSPRYSPVLQSPVLQRSRNVTPVSPLISPPAIDQQGANFSGSNSSLLDDVHLLETNSLDSPVCLDMFAQLNLSTRREGMGSSSSLSSLNSPRFAPVAKSPHPIFTFNNPPIDSSGYSSSTCYSDTDNPESAGILGNSLANPHQNVASLPVNVHPPSYEEHVTQHAPTGPSPHVTPPHRPTCFTPTRSGTHPLQISLAAPDPNRPRSGSEPAPVNLTHRYPTDIDMDLFNTSGFPDCDVDSIIRTEMQYSNGELDFQFDQQQCTSSPYPTSDPTLTSATLGPDHLRLQQGTSAW